MAVYCHDTLITAYMATIMTDTHSDQEALDKLQLTNDSIAENTSNKFT